MGDVDLSRRQLLLAGAAFAAAAPLGACSATRRHHAQAPPSCSPSPHVARLAQIEHVVIVVQENRSFDHYFGTYRGVRGFDDRPPGSPGAFSQRGPVGVQVPFHLDTSTTNAACTNDITHDWAPQHRAWNNGAMDGWARAHADADGTDGGLTMGYYTRADLPFFYALADAFTLCDGYHCSVLGPTHPNRLYSLSATLDPAGKAGGPVVRTESVTTARAAQWSKSWTTMPERLSAHGVSWKVYQQPGFDRSPLALAVSNNALFYFRQYADPASALHQQAFLPTWPAEFEADVASGELPSVSWVLSPLGADEHPPASPQLGEAFIHRLMTALMANTAVWGKTVVFITYDENGGFFDHLAPPTPPPGTLDEELTVSPLPAEAGGVVGPIGLGFRVPLLVVSPFSRGGWVASERFDHTSLLRFLETRFGVEAPNLSAWRRSVTGDLTSTLDLATPDLTVPALPATPGAADPVVVRECPVNELITPVPHYPIPPAPPLPTQEPGTARRRQPACR